MPGGAVGFPSMLDGQGSGQNCLPSAPHVPGSLSGTSCDLRRKDLPGIGIDCTAVAKGGIGMDRAV